ncbi:MAG: hypothetical protein JNK72_24890 [Myxococcales bacterium]|nr:hypothetical protein [Myxococcales bacterium]
MAVNVVTAAPPSSLLGRVGLVYRNLHACPAAWSVKDRKLGRVGAVTQAVMLANAVGRIGKKVQEKVRRERRKAVHAFIVGTVTSPELAPRNPAAEGWVEVTYNPYLFDTFVMKANGRPFPGSQYVYAGPDMKLWALLWPEDADLVKLRPLAIPADRLALFEEVKRTSKRHDPCATKASSNPGPPRRPAHEHWNG